MFNRKIGTISKKIHTPYEGMFGLGGTQGYEKEVTGTGYIDLTNAIANRLLELKVYGGTEQNGTPTPETPMDIWCNNGVLKYGCIGKNLVNPDAVTQNSYINSSGGISSDNSFIISDYIPVQGRQNITMSTINTSAFPFGGAACKAFYDSNKNYIRNSATANSGIKANNPATLVVPANAAYFRTSIAKVAVSSAQVEYGDTATTFEPYKAGIYTDGTTETVWVHSKNLFDKNNTLEDGKIWTSGTGTQGNLSGYYGASPIKVKGGHTYTRSGSHGGANYFLLDDNTSFLVQDGSDTITVPDNAVMWYFNNTTSTDRNTAMVVEGSTATAYEPYYDGGTATAEMLLKVGDYQDVQSVLDGNVTRNIGIKVFDGTEDWKYASSSQFFYADISNLNALESTHTCYCTHFQGKSTDVAITSGSNQCKVGWNIGSSIVWNRIYISPDISLYADVNAIKQWLSDQYANGTPVIVVYPLATATTETVTGQPMNIQAGTNTIEITQASIDNLQLYAKYKSTSE